MHYCYVGAEIYGLPGLAVCRSRPRQDAREAGPAGTCSRSEEHLDLVGEHGIRREAAGFHQHRPMEVVPSSEGVLQCTVPTIRRLDVSRALLRRSSTHPGDHCKSISPRFRHHGLPAKAEIDLKQAGTQQHQNSEMQLWKGRRKSASWSKTQCPRFTEVTSPAMV